VREYYDRRATEYDDWYEGTGLFSEHARPGWEGEIRYGHLQPAERASYLAEARAVAGELVVVDAGRRGGEPREEWQTRVLSDGSRHQV
jgi:hypothetical protein